jgi:tetratricopeptide (TPR) repeat protein
MENHSAAEINSLVDKISSLRKEKRYGDAASLIDESLTRYPRSVELLDERGWWYLEQEQYFEALEAFEKALAAVREDEGALQGMIASLRKLGRFKEAGELLSKSVELYPESTGILSERGWLYFDQRQYAKAGDAFIFAKNESAIPLVSAALRSRRAFDEAERVLTEAAKAFPNSAGILSERGWLLFTRGQYDRARDCFEQALEATSGSSAQDTSGSSAQESPLQGKIASLRKLGQFEEAERLISKGLGSMPVSPGIASERAWLHFDQGNLGKAAEEFSKLVEGDPDSLSLTLSLAEILLRLHRTDDALSALERPRQRFPEHPEVREKLGQIHARRHDLVAAEREFRSILESDAENVLGMNGLGLIRFHQARYEEAEQYFDKALRVEPNNAVFRVNLARALVQQETQADLDEAKRLCSEVLATDRDHGPAMVLLGVVAFRQGDLLQAESYLRRSVERNPSEGSHADLGALYIQIGRYEEAEEVLRRAIDLNRYDGQAYLELGNLYLQTNQQKKAIQEFRKAVAVDPGDDRAAYALAVALAETGGFDEAEKILRTALKRMDMPKRWRLHLALAYVLTRMGDDSSDLKFYEFALKEVDQAILLKPRHPEPYFQGGILRSKLGEYKDALKKTSAPV